MATPRRGLAVRKRLAVAVGYGRLLTAVGPSALDHVLLVVGVLGSIGAGLPFPLMAVLFGELLDQLSSASCADEPPPPSYHDSLSRKVLWTVCAALANFLLLYVSSGAWSLFGERLVRRLRSGYLGVLL